MTSLMRGPLGALLQRSAFVVVIGLLLVISAARGAFAEDVILHPGYIQGSVFIPDGLGGEYPIQRIEVSANGTDPATGNDYTASITVEQTDEFVLVVEGGDWPYWVNITVYYGDAYDQFRYARWQRRIVVPVGDSVPLPLQTDAFVAGTVSVGGESVTYMRPEVYSTETDVGSPQYGFRSCAPFDGGNYQLPVVSGDALYWVLSGSIRLTGPSDYITLGRKEASVAAGYTAVVDFSVTPAYVEGQVTVNGAVLINDYGYVGVMVTDPTTGQSFYGGTRLSPDGSYRVTVPPGWDVTAYGNVYTDAGYHSLIYKYLDDLGPGDTGYCYWEITLSGWISGDVAITGINLDGVVVYAYGPNGASRNATIHTPGDHFQYEFDSLAAGQWGIFLYAWDSEHDAAFGIGDCDYYYSPMQYVDVAAGEHSTVDVTINPGFIGGSILAGNSASIAELYYAQVRARPSDSLWPTYSKEWAYTYQIDGNLEDEHSINFYDMFVGPGEWWVYRSDLRFRHWHPDLGYYTESRLIVVEWNPTDQVHNVPLLAVYEGETAEFDFGYQTGRIDTRFRVATGEPLSYPHVQGNYLRNAEGIKDRNVTLIGDSSVSDVLEGFVHLHAVPGTYRLTAKAYVQGSYTTFGEPFEVTVGPGDVIKTDPNAPTLEISFPPGYYETTGDSVDVWGTVTDESGVESLTINGEAVTINEDGTYEHTVSDLQTGENIIELVASDIYGNVTSIQRIVIRVNPPPEAVIGGPYAGSEGSAITFDASGSSDPVGDPLEYRWDFDGNGTWDTPYSADATATHTWGDDHVGTVIVEVSDGENLDTASTSVTVSNVAPIITSMDLPAGPVPRGVTVDLTGAFTDAGALDTHTAEINWGDGTIAAGAVSESAGSGTVAGSHAYTASGVHTVTLTITDDDGAAQSQEMVIIVNSPPVAVLGGPYSGVEGSAIAFDASGSSDPDGDPVQFRWDFDSNGTWDTGYSANPVAAFTWDDDHTGAVAIEVSDGELTDTASTGVSVANVNPTITSIAGPVDPIPVGTTVDVTGAFTDPGILDTHTAEIAWGDGSVTAGTVSESGGSGTVVGSRVYAVPGVYRVTLTVNDDDGGSDSMEFVYAVVYDPAGAFVTGGGQFDSPAGAYAADPTLTGKAGFGFISKYQKGTTVPSGNTQFRFHAGDLSFKSTVYEWLVVAGARAQFKGTGMINGAGNYGFMLTAIDGEMPGGGGIDRIRIKIWDKDNGDAVVYDNLMDADDDAAPTTALTHGSIKIHQG
jgi:hypothetical protein